MFLHCFNVNTGTLKIRTSFSASGSVCLDRGECDTEGAVRLECEHICISPDDEGIVSVSRDAEHLDIDAPAKGGRSVAHDARALDDESDTRKSHP